MREWKLWDWIAFVCLWTAALMETYGAGASHVSLPPLEGLWALAPLLLLIAATVIFLLRAVRPRQSQTVLPVWGVTSEEWDKPLKPVFRKKYSNETVELDGCEFTECNFRNVTLHYAGTRPFRFTNSQFHRASEKDPAFKFSTRHPVAVQMAIFYASMGGGPAMIEDIRGPDGISKL